MWRVLYGRWVEAEGVGCFSFILRSDDGRPLQQIEAIILEVKGRAGVLGWSAARAAGQSLGHRG